jgi:hypothetical protein
LLFHIPHENEKYPVFTFWIEAVKYRNERIVLDVSISHTLSLTSYYNNFSFGFQLHIKCETRSLFVMKVAQVTGHTFHVFHV